MITAKEARAKTEEKVSESLVLAVLNNIETKIVWNAEVGKSTLEWDFGNSDKLGIEIKRRLEALGYKTEMCNRYRTLRISW